MLRQGAINGHFRGDGYLFPQPPFPHAYVQTGRQIKVNSVFKIMLKILGGPLHSLGPTSLAAALVYTQFHLQGLEGFSIN